MWLNVSLWFVWNYFFIFLYIKSVIRVIIKLNKFVLNGDNLGNLIESNFLGNIYELKFIIYMFDRFWKYWY